MVAAGPACRFRFPPPPPKKKRKDNDNNKNALSTTILGDVGRLVACFVGAKANACLGYGAVEAYSPSEGEGGGWAVQYRCSGALGGGCEGLEERVPSAAELHRLLRLGVVLSQLETEKKVIVCKGTAPPPPPQSRGERGR